MAKLPYIADELLVAYTKEVLVKAQAAFDAAEDKLESNIIDPFSALFDSLRQEITLDEWLQQEQSRQVQKTLQNALGEFHQNILGAVDGWENPGRGGGYDIISHNHKVLGEIKNKFNTMNSSASESTYRKLEHYIEGDYTGYIAYVIFIIPRNAEDYDKPWTPNRVTMPLRDDIRQIDGESFYRLVSGYDDALEDLFDVLPDVIAEILGQAGISQSEKSKLKEFFVKAYK